MVMCAEKQAFAEETESTVLEERSGAAAGNLLQIVGVGVLTVMTLWLCGVLAFFAAFSSGGPLWDPSEMITLREWVRRISNTTQASLTVTIISMGFFAVLAAATVVAAWFRSRTWVAAGALNCALLLLAVVFSSVLGPIEVNNAIEKTFERLGPVKFAEPVEVSFEMQSDGAEALTRSSTSFEMVEHEVLTLAAAPGPYVVAGPNAASAQEFLPGDEAGLLLRESCTPAPSSDLGTQLSLSFSLPSDDDGQVNQHIVEAWVALGYSDSDHLRSDSFFGKSGSALQQISVRDHSSIDGQLTIRLVSDCADRRAAATDSAPIEVR